MYLVIVDRSVQCQTSRTEFDLPLLKRSMLELWIGVKAARYFPCTRSSSRLNVGHVPIYNNGKFAPACHLRHHRRDVTYIAFYCVLMGKVYWNALVAAAETTFKLLLWMTTALYTDLQYFLPLIEGSVRMLVASKAGNRPAARSLLNMHVAMTFVLLMRSSCLCYTCRCC